MQSSSFVRTPLTIVSLALLLGGCLGGDSGSSATLSGTAAVGAPIVGGNVAVQCAGGNALNTLTSAAGAWSVTLTGQTLPCVVQVSGGTVAGGANTIPLHSIALQPGTVNITPLTDLIVANLINQAPAGWFTTGLNAGAFAAMAGNALQAAMNNVVAALDLSAALGNMDPFTTAFNATVDDDMDKILEALKGAIAAVAGFGYADLLAAVQNGGGIELPPGFSFADALLALDGNGGQDPEAPAHLALLAAYAGTYTVTGTGTEDAGLRGFATRDHARGTITIHANGNVDFDTNISFTAGQVVALFDRRMVDHDKRVAINYGPSDAHERIRIYLDAAGTGIANVTEIIHDDGQGGTTRALVQPPAGGG